MIIIIIIFYSLFSKLADKWASAWNVLESNDIVLRIQFRNLLNSSLQLKPSSKSSIPAFMQAQTDSKVFFNFHGLLRNLSSANSVQMLLKNSIAWLRRNCVLFGDTFLTTLCNYSKQCLVNLKGETWSWTWRVHQRQAPTKKPWPTFDSWHHVLSFWTSMHQNRNRSTADKLSTVDWHVLELFMSP